MEGFHQRENPVALTVVSTAEKSCTTHFAKYCVKLRHQPYSLMCGSVNRLIGHCEYKKNQRFLRMNKWRYNVVINPSVQAEWVPTPFGQRG